MNTTRHAGTPVPEWTTSLDALRLIVRGYTFRTGTRVAVVVGTLLSIVNQGAVVVSGDATTLTAVRIVANYLIPFVVASVGYLAPFRVRTRRSRGCEHVPPARSGPPGS